MFRSMYTTYLVTIFLILNGIKCENDGATAQMLPSAYSHENSEMDHSPHFTQPDQLNRLIVKPPGQMLNIRCAASGNPEPSITWTKDSDVIDRVGEVKTRGWTLVLKNLESKDSGYYRCELCNIHGCINHTTHLIVERDKILSNKHSNEPKESYKSPIPHFTQPDQLNSEILKPSGHMLNIRCAASGNPEPSITWTKDSDVIDRVGEVKTRGWTLVLKNLESKDSGYYRCELCNIHGCINHTTHLIVERDKILSNKHSNEPKESYKSPIPHFTQPDQLNSEILKPSGHMLNIRCAASGNPEPSITWTKDSDVIDRVGEVKTRGWTLVLKNLEPKDSGHYRCELCNIHGCIFHTTKVLVEGGEKLTSIKKSGTFWLLTTLAISIILAILIKPIRKWLWLNGNLLLNSSETNSSWEFPRDRLSIVKTIGVGNFGLVYKAKALGSLGRQAQRNVAVRTLNKIIWKAYKLLGYRAETNVAVKTLKENQSWIRNSYFLREIELMKMIGKHENIVSFLGCCTLDGPIYAIIEYTHLSDLRTYLVKRKNCFLTKTLISFAGQVACGMEHLANLNCIHRDLAARNVLVFLSNKIITVKISDFGLARDLRGSRYCYPLESEATPYRWRAPETLPNNVHVMNSDVWSYGVLLWEIMSFGSLPYSHLDDAREIYDFLEEGERMSKPPNCSDEIYDLMRQCWQWEPGNRPLFGEICNTLDGI